MGIKITNVDNDGIKSRDLPDREFGYDNYAAGGDLGRVSIGTSDGGNGKKLAFKDEMVEKASGQALATSDALGITGDTITMTKGDGSTEDVVLPTASDTVSGLVELATLAEVQAGTDATRAVTPAGLKSIADTKIDVADADTLGSIISIPTSRIICSDLQLTNTINKLTFDAIAYTGNGTSQTITTGLSSIDLTDSTQALVTTGLPVFHDRDNISGVGGDCIMVNSLSQVVDSGDITFDDYGIDGLIQVHIKGLSVGTSNHDYDGIRGIQKAIMSDSSGGEFIRANSLLAFTSTGVTIGSDMNNGTNGATYISYVTLYTHLKWGITEGARWIEAYNPVTNMGMRIRQGSNSVINVPHSLGSVVDYSVTKILNGTSDGLVYYGDKDKFLKLYSTVNGAMASAFNSAWRNTSPTDEVFSFEGNLSSTNQAGGVYIDYYRAKSKTWGIFSYIGTDTFGNFIETKDVDGIPRRPSRVTIKVVTTTGNWEVFDYARTGYGYIALNLSNAEQGTNAGIITFSNNGFSVDLNDGATNSSNSQYIALVEFDTNANNGGSYAPIPTATTQVEISDAVALYSTFDEATGYTQSKEIIAGTQTLTIANGWED